MIPTLLVLGFGAGLLSHRLRTLSVAVSGLGLLWACLIAFGAANDPAGIFGALALGTANATVGVLAGATVRLTWFSVKRLMPIH